MQSIPLKSQSSSTPSTRSTEKKKTLTAKKMQHLKADVNVLYLPKTSGGSDFIQIKITSKTATIGLDNYLNIAKNILLMTSRDLEKKTTL